jgi:iron(III) transport system ATP-binding protein
MNKGVVAQMGTPQEIYYHPNSEFVADFIGECNFLPCTVTGREGEDVTAEVYGHPVKVRSEHDKLEGAAEIVLRPEAIELADQGLLPCKVELSCFMGSYQNYHVRVGDTLVKIADNCPIGRKTYQVGDEAYISFRSECAHLLAT